MTVSGPVYDAIVLAGGAARRLGGVDKPMLDLDGRPLLAHVLQAVGSARRVVVVGPPRTLTAEAGPAEVLWCREDPPGGGPVAAISAAVPLVHAGIVVVLAADLPAVAPAVPVLLAALEDRDVAVLQAGERVNYLAAAWRTAALRERLADLEPVGAAMRTVFAGARTALVTDSAGWSADWDTWADVARHRGAPSRHD